MSTRELGKILVKLQGFFFLGTSFIRMTLPMHFGGMTRACICATLIRHTCELT